MSTTEPLDLATATEQQLRDHELGWPKSEDELLAIVRTLAEREHDYGTCVYAMSIAATAAFYYVAHKLGVTGFQASCADMDVLRRTRLMKHGFRLIDYSELLYPQYQDKLTLSPESMLADPATRHRMRNEAKKLLADNRDPHPAVLAHWQMIAALPVLDDEPQAVPQ